MFKCLSKIQLRGWDSMSSMHLELKDATLGPITVPEAILVCPVKACCFIPVESCFLLAGAFGMQVWHFPVVETIDWTRAFLCCRPAMPASRNEGASSCIILYLLFFFVGVGFSIPHDIGKIIVWNSNHKLQVKDFRFRGRSCWKVSIRKDAPVPSSRLKGCEKKT